MKSDTGIISFDIGVDLNTFIDWTINYFEGKAKHLTLSNSPAFENSKEGMMLITSQKLHDNSINIIASYRNKTEWIKNLVLRVSIHKIEDSKLLSITCLFPQNDTFEDFFGRYKIKAIQHHRQRKGKLDKTNQDEKINYVFDIALSFSGKQRPFVELVNKCLKSKGLKTFYDLDHQINHWGKNLPDYFEDIYSRKSKFVVIFISNEYLNSDWTNLERQYAIIKMMESKEEYILPIKFNDVNLPGVPTTISYLSIGELTPEDICERIFDKFHQVKNK